MKRRDIIIVALPGDKPRPAIVVQSDELTRSESVLVCPFTSGLEFAAPHRTVVEPAPENGLRAPSVLMTEKLQTIRRDKCGEPVGSLSRAQMVAIDAQMAFVLGLSLAD